MTNRGTRAIARPVSRANPRRARQRVSLKKRIKDALAFAFLLCEAAAAILLVCFTVVFWRFTQDDLDSLEAITSDVKAPVATTIWSEDGVELGRLEVQNRKPVDLKDTPALVKDATVSIEDHRFYEHNGVDPIGVVRAVVVNLRSGNRAAQGGSTLTQQLVRNLNQFNLSKEKKFKRKIREAFTAIRVEQLYSKDEILQLYLNNIYYGGGAYGIKAAASTYFGKSLSKLDLSEIALLAGIPQRPNDLTPFEHRKAALARRDEVLAKMLEYGKISQADYDKAVKETLHFKKRPPVQKHQEFKAPYFVTYVLKGLIRKYGAEYVYSGLKIQTTLNWKMQREAEKTLANGLRRYSGLGANQGALVSIDNSTGYIRAMVGGRSFMSDQFNAVTQGRRQPGSTFKLFDYATAFEEGAATLYSPTFPDTPFAYRNDPQHREVTNYGGGASGAWVNSLTAIKFSKNTVAVRVADKVGIKSVIKMAHKMGITTPLAPYLPTALGASAVRPLDLASAYSVIPMRGQRCEPMAIVRISDSGDNVIAEREPKIYDNVIKTETAEMMNTALEGVVTSGTGTMARGDESNGIVENAHGKTGTTSDNRDAWFAGYTPELTTVIWVASVHRSAHGRITYATMQGATGGHLCAPMWHDFMIAAVPIQRQFKTNAPSIHVDMSSGGTNADTENKPTKKRWHRDPDAATTDDGAGDAANPDDTAKDKPATDKTKPQDGQPDDGSPGPDSPKPQDGQTEPDAPVTGTPDEQLPTQPEPGDGSKPPKKAAPPLRGRTPSTKAKVEGDSETMVTVHVCVDSGHIANEYCPAYRVMHVSAKRRRQLGKCRQHHAPPGEE